MITPDSALISTPRCTEATALRYLMGRGSWYAPEARAEIVAAYWSVCASVGLDPLLALAQCIHETSAQQANKEWWPLSSWWAQRPRRNPAGIGVTGRSASREMHDAYPERYVDFQPGPDGRWQQGLAFKSWRDDAIPAHAGRMLAYALREGQGTSPQKRLIDVALNLRSLPASYRGIAPTLRGLNGRWATGQGYAAAISDIANAMMRA